MRKKLRKLNWAAIGSAAFLAAFWVWVIVFIVMCCTGCTTTRTTETSDYRHEMSLYYGRIDSLIRIRFSEKQDSQSHLLRIRDSLVLRERTIVNTIQTVDIDGNVISTNTSSTTERERDHSTQTEKEDVWISRMQTIDSLISVNQQQSERIDSLLQSHNKEVVKQQEPIGWWAQLWRNLRYILSGIVIGFAGAFALKWKLR